MVRDWYAALIAGAASGFAVDVSLYPLDTVKTRLQSKQGFRKSGGFRGIYKGIGPAAIGSAPGAAVFFTVYDTSNKIIASYQSKNEFTEINLCLHHMLAASMGEIGACMVRVPVEVIKQRSQTQMQQTSWKILNNTLRSDGVAGLYQGYITTLLREIPFSLIQFPLWEFLKQRLRNSSKHNEISPLQSAICGMFSGGIAAGLTTPIDVAKTRIMIANKNEMESSGKFIAVIKDIYKTKGFKGLYAGATPRILWISIGGFIFLGTYDFVKNLLQH